MPRARGSASRRPRLRAGAARSTTQGRRSCSTASSRGRSSRDRRRRFCAAALVAGDRPLAAGGSSCRSTAAASSLTRRPRHPRPAARRRRADEILRPQVHRPGGAATSAPPAFATRRRRTCGRAGSIAGHAGARRPSPATRDARGSSCCRRRRPARLAVGDAAAPRQPWVLAIGAATEDDQLPLAVADALLPGLPLVHAPTAPSSR